jgi:hypothetical protein
VPFKESIHFLIEQGNGSPPFRSGNYYYSVAYWYQTEPHAPFPPLPGAKERIAWAAGAKDVLEGESLKIAGKSGGVTEIQTEGRWSGSKQLWWRDGRPGDRLELAVPVAKSGCYRLVMHNTRAFDYGIFQLSLDGQRLGGPIDLYSRENVTRLVTVGQRELSQGEHRLTVEIVGTNPAAKPRYMFGLDYLKLEPVR